MKKLCIALWCVLLPSMSFAMTMKEEQVVCPIGGESFTVSLPASGTAFNNGLDFMPLGAIVSPWPLAKCPSNGFVMFQEVFTPEELKRLTSYVNTPEYQALQKTHTNYYLVAKLAQAKGDSEVEVSDLMLQATWEAKTPEQYKDYASQAHAAFTKIGQSQDPQSDAWVTTQYILGELDRRMSNFKEAQQHMDTIKNRKLNEPWQPAAVKLQLELISKADAQPHSMPE